MNHMAVDKWKIATIALAIALIASLLYILTPSIFQGGIETQTPYNSTTTYTQSSTTIASTGTASVPTETSIPFDFGNRTSLREKARKVIEKLRELEQQGYDVYYIEYLVLSAIYHYEKGYRDKAIEIFNKAVDELKHIELLPELPSLEFSIEDNTLYIKGVPTTWDFVPIGTVFVLTDKGYLAYPRNDPQWKLSCFIVIAIGYGEGGLLSTFMYQGRLPLIPRETPASGFRPRFYLNNKWIQPDIRFVGPLYYDSGEKFGYPTVYEYDLSGRYMEYLTYIRENRTWIHAIIDTVENRELLYIKARAIGEPLWLGKWNESYIVHGVYAKEKALDLWSGFWDVCEMEARVYLRRGTYRVYHGLFVVDRASHRVYGVESSYRRLGSPLAFSCMALYQENLTVMISYSINPSPWNPGYSFEHQMRINILGQGIVVDVVNFTLEQEGYPQPTKLYIYGVFDGGYINLTGEVISYWPEYWVKDPGIWWSDSGAGVWGRAFIQWSGVIVVDGRVIEVQCMGAGEFTRYTSDGSGGQCSDDNYCWCR